MSKSIIKLLMLLTYCFPYAYLGMNGNVNYGTMIFYALMTVCLGILCAVALSTKNIIVLIIGNTLSSISSYFFILQNQMEEWYIKPFTSIVLLITVTIIAIIIQAIVILLVKKNKINIVDIYMFILNYS